MKMRKTLCFLIALALIAAGCGCCHSAPAAPSGSSGARSEEEWSGGTEPSSAGRQEAQSISDAQQWKKPEDWAGTLEDFHAAPFDPETDAPVTRKFTPVDTISVSGKYAMPVITNETPLEDMIVSISGDDVIILENMLASAFATDYSCLPLRDIWGNAQKYDYIPVTFLRKTGESSYYTVCKVDGGGYAYFFFDRLRDSESGEYLTTDKTDIYLYGAIYAEEMHSYAAFANLKVGDSIDRVAEIDHKTYFDKTAVEEYWLAGKKYAEEHGNETIYAKDPMFAVLHLLNNGVLQIGYQYEDPDFDAVYDESKDPAYTYDFSNYKIIDMQYYPDYMVKPYYRLAEADMGFYNAASNLRILPIDWRAAT